MFSADQPPNTTAADHGYFTVDWPDAPNSGGGIVYYARSLHPGGANASAVDGSVHFISDNVSEDVFYNLGSIAGGESNTGWE